MNRRHLAQSRMRSDLLGLAQLIERPDTTDGELLSIAAVMRQVADALKPPPGQIVYPGPGVRNDIGAEERAADDQRWLRRRTWETVGWLLLTASLLVGAIILAWLCPPVALVGTVVTASWLAWALVMAKWKMLEFVRKEVKSGIRPALRRGPLESVELDVGGPGEFIAERWDERAWLTAGWVLHRCCSRCGWDTTVTAERDGELQAEPFADVAATRRRALELVQGTPDQQDAVIAWLEARAAAEEAGGACAVDADDANKCRHAALVLRDAADVYPTV